MRATMLVVDDDERMRHTVSLLLRTSGHDVLSASDVATAEAVLRDREVDLVISDLRMPGGSGMNLLGIVQRLGGDVPLILLTAYGTIEGAVQAMQHGAFDSSWPTAAPSFSTRSAMRRSSCSRSCSGCCRSGSSSGLARTTRARSTCGSCRPPTATSRR